MSRKAVAAAVLALLCAATAKPANAATSYREWLNYCGGSGLPGMTMCGSVKVQVVDNQVTLWVQNLSGLYGSYQNFVFTSISFFNANPAVQIPDVVEGTVSSMSGPVRTANSSNPPPSWKLTNQPGAGGKFGLDFNPGVNGMDGGIASSCANNLPGGSNDLWMTPSCGSTGVTNAGANGGWVVMTFSMNGFWDLNATDTQLQIHAQSDAGSIKCTTGYDCYPSTATPEPATLALVGTGLAAMAASRRRRKKGQAEAAAA
jgi:hypothetical protein